MKPNSDKPSAAPSGPPSEGAVDVHDLTLQIEEMQEALAAIRSGEVDALVISPTSGSPEIFLLKEAQVALRRQNEELEANVRERTAELEKLNDALRAEIAERARLGEELSRKAEELELTDRRKDEFLSMLAHELRNPLSPILSAVEMLKSVGRESSSVERHRAVIERQAVNLARLVDDLLDVSRITRRAIHIHLQPSSLTTIVQRAADAARPLIDANGHTLSLHLPAEPMSLFADPLRLEQVVVNLLNNAAKYTPRGGRISVTTEIDGAQAVIRVQDNGMGMSPELLPHVFELFVQGERGLDRAQGGLGLGLTLVKSLVEMHGGTVEAHSEGPGRGSEVTVRLPLPSQEPQLAAEPEPEPDTGTDTDAHAPPNVRPTATERRVLLVEDNADVATSMVDLLELWGYQVSAVDNGEDALRAMASFRPHGALVDVGLPQMNGYELARRMRSMEAPGERILLIGITGYGQEQDRRAGAEAGFDHYLVKPPNIRELQQILERSLKP